MGRTIRWKWMRPLIPRTSVKDYNALAFSLPRKLVTT